MSIQDQKNNRIVFIHAGMHKTGSTYLQHYFAKNRKYLKSHNIIYPKFEYEDRIFFNQSMPISLLFSREHPSWVSRELPPATSINDLTKDLFFNLNKILKSKKNILLSDEHISTLRLHELLKLKNFFYSQGYAVRLIVFIRNPAFYIISKFQQLLPLYRFEEIVKNNELSTSYEKKKLLNIIKIFSKHSIFSYDAVSDLANTFYEDFLKIPRFKNQIKIDNINRSICSESLDIIKFMNTRAPKIYLDGITNLDILNYYNQFSVLKKIPGERFKPSKDIYAILKPLIAELNLVYAKVLGKEFIAKDSKFATKEVSWNIEQLEYIKNNMHLFYERNKPIINGYFEQTTFKGERERHYYENQIRPYLGVRYMPWCMVTKYLKIFAQYLYYRNIRIKFYWVISKFKQSLLMNVKNGF